MSRKLDRIENGLTIAERHSLSWNLSMKGDESEADRITLAPLEWLERRRLTRRMHAFAHTLAQYQIEQLTDAASFLSFKLNAVCEGGLAEEKEIELGGQLALAAYLFLARREGWFAFCRSIGIDDTICEKGFGAEMVLSLCATNFEELQATAEEICSILAGKGVENVAPDSIASPASFQKYFSDLFERLNGQNCFRQHP